ncbi:MAG TPA: LysR substrate-binding domain-containing protein [Rhizomicrobium sp.]|nr:LysR substrate-binding domain-containing protein [Rhizomicrobium sp.]
MKRSIPPLEALEAFLAAARMPSFRAAAESLALSPSAFSRRVQQLERFLGKPLFDRSGLAPVLTPAGKKYRGEMEMALDTIAAATRRFHQAPQERLRLMCPQSFAMTWLMPRLPAFITAFPDIDLQLTIGRDVEILRQGVVDIAIMSGPRNFDDLPMLALMDLDAIVVAAPELAGGRQPPRTIADLHQHCLLGVDTPGDLWPRFLDRIGAPDPKPRLTTSFATLALMYEAAANGLGVTLAIPAVSNTYLRDGRLRPCFEAHAQLDTYYRLVMADPATTRRKDVRAFSQWLITEVESTRIEFNGMLSAPTNADLRRLPN